jgi:cytochrome c peroxidase
MKSLNQLVLGSLLLVVLATSCNKKADFTYNYYTVDGAPAYDLISKHLNLNDSPASYEVVLPKHITGRGLSARKVDDNKAVLGRVLFWDSKLSKDGKISCGSCHAPNKAFGDNVAFSKGITDRATTRNSIALASVLNFSAYYGTDINGFGAVPFFWDNRAGTVALQSTGSLTNPNEMGMQMHEVVDQVKAQEYYKPLFNAAFGNTEVTQDRILDAVANFVNALGSHKSRFDIETDKIAGEYNWGFDYRQNYASFTQSENNGKRLYIDKCGSCHGSTFAAPQKLMANNGLEGNNPSDKGVGGVTHKTEEYGMFKVPTLRNITRSAPYMHDGRFNTLEEVLEHYSTNMKYNDNLSNEFKGTNNTAKKITLTAQDKVDLIAFLSTLEDFQLPLDKRFDDPFKK